MSIDRKTLVESGLATSLARGRTAVRTCICRVLQGDQAVTETALGSRPIVVGAGKDCDLILADPQVSRRHAELALVPSGVRVRDHGSTNGTWWQGTRITEVVVPMGSLVRFGSTNVRFLSGQAPTVPPSTRTRFGGMVGQSLPMRELFAVLELAARELREMTFATFRRVAVLCTTAAGVLQVRRLSGQLDASRHLVTTDDAQAVAFAAVRQSTRPPPRIVEGD
jgi:hypothetical protein